MSLLLFLSNFRFLRLWYFLFFIFCWSILSFLFFLFFLTLTFFFYFLPFLSFLFFFFTTFFSVLTVLCQCCQFFCVLLPFQIYADEHLQICQYEETVQCNHLKVEEVCISREALQPCYPQEACVNKCIEDTCKTPIESFDIVHDHRDWHKKEECNEVEIMQSWVWIHYHFHKTH